MSVARQIVVYSWLTVAVSLVLWPLATGWVYAAVAAAAGAALVVESHRLLRDTRAGATARPMRLFHLSNTYLAVLFVARRRRRVPALTAVQVSRRRPGRRTWPSRRSRG